MPSPNYESDPGSLPIESADDAALQLLRGSVWGPNAKLILPSGRQLSGAEAQAFTAAFEPVTEMGSTDTVADFDDDPGVYERGCSRTHSNPLSRSNDRWTDDPETNRAQLVARAMEALHQSTAEEVPREKKSWFRRFLYE